MPEVADLADLLTGPDHARRSTSTACMWAYQVVSRPAPVLTWTSQGPAQDWSVSMTTVPSVAARTGVPQASGEVGAGVAARPVAAAVAEVVLVREPGCPASGITTVPVGHVRHSHELVGRHRPRSPATRPGHGLPSRPALEQTLSERLVVGIRIRVRRALDGLRGPVTGIVCQPGTSPGAS